MTTIKPELTFNCPENWDNMKIGLVSRHCLNCNRDVQDFTKFSKEEILQYLWTNRNSKVCGRIYKFQLDYHHEEILITIDSYLRKNKNSNLSFYLLAIGTTMLLSCTSNEHSQRIQTNDSLDFLLHRQELAFVLSGEKKESKVKEPSSESKNCKSDTMQLTELIVLGDITSQDPRLGDTSDLKRARTLAEVMPEFIGGFDSLVVYIKKNLKYPEWEKKAGIEGNVFVSFTVEIDGQIVNPKIIRSVEGSKNFDNEVLRLVKEMPAWIPGQEQGRNVPVEFILPIGFKL